MKIQFDTIEEKKAFWHTSAHILAAAVLRLYPDVKFAIGPAIDTGFYYDFDFINPISQDDLPKIEEEMKKIIEENNKTERFSLPIDEALEFMKNQPYKIELIKGKVAPGEEAGFVKHGDFVDLCAGKHLPETSFIKAFKLLNATGAYWKGDSKNKMLTRIYGVSFPKPSLLQEYLKNLEEAKLRDHRKIGKEMGIFTTSDLVGKGLPMYLPNGYIIWNLLEEYIKEKERNLGYQHVLTPPIGSIELYKTSGHWEHYQESMFPAMERDGETFVLRPMNCPHHMMIYKENLHSYKDLPIRIGEIARDLRYEASGTLKGLERSRCFCQNDAHLFVTSEQIKDEFEKVVKLILDVYKDFEIKDYRFALSLRDPADKEKYYQDDEMWENAEAMLRKVLDDIGISYTEEIGEAAFYGPKLDVQVKPAVGNEISLSTCQLDFCLPQRFDLSYVDSDNSKKTPVVLHRAILGSIDRFIAYILEETKGALPVWLAPEQIRILPISDNFIENAEKIAKEIRSFGILRVKVDTRNEKVGYKIREAQTEKVPYMLILGQKEIENGSVSVRDRKAGDMGEMSIPEFAQIVLDKIREKK